MTDWDAPVARWAEAKVGELRTVGVAQLLQELVGWTWRRNADNHDESAGDTAKSLGVTQSENLRVLTVRRYHDERSAWAARGVKVTEPEQSLLVSTAGLALHPMKAPTNVQRQPEWNTWRWSTETQVRLEAARTNRASYLPAFAPPLPGMETLGQDPNVLSHAMIVYCGDLITGRTAGWFAVPSADEAGRESGHPWMATALMWWDDESDAGGGLGWSPGGGDGPTSPTHFDTQPTPDAPVTLRPTRRPSTS